MAAAAVAQPAEAAPQSTGGSDAVYVVPAQALLLYLCPDRDLYAGMTKAVSVVAQSALLGARVDTQGILKMCYPLVQPEQAAAVCKAPLTAQQIAAAVAVAAVAGTVPPAIGPAAAAAASTAGAKSSGGSGGAGTRKPSTPGTAADAQAAASDAEPASIKPSQLMYSAATERVLTLLLHRYQWVDVFVNTLL